MQSLVQRWRGKYKPNTVLHRARGLKRFLHWCESFGLSATLRQAIPPLRRAAPRQVVATGDELARLKAHAPVWMRFFILLCHDTALRFAEALSAAPMNFNPEINTLTIRKKGGDDHTVPISPEMRAIIDALPADAAITRPFVEILRAQPIGASAMHEAFRVLVGKAGVNPKLTPHDLRRTRITSLYMETKDLRVCQQLAGHREMWQTAQYVAHLDIEGLRDIMKHKPFVVLQAIKKAVSQ